MVQRLRRGRHPAERDGAALSEHGTESQLFALFDTLPFGVLAGVAAMVLIVTFFVTSADSATFVLGALGSKDGQDPACSVSVVWGLVIAASAAVLLVSGGLGGVQTASIVAAFPFAIVLLLMVVSLAKGLREEGGVAPEQPVREVAGQ